MPTIDENDREINVQFSFSNKEAIPSFLEDLPEENRAQAVVRNQKPDSGAELTAGDFKGKMVDIKALPKILLDPDYLLVGVWKQQRTQTKGPMKNRPYWMIRFRFRRKDQLTEYVSAMSKEAWQEIEKNRPMWIGELVAICSLAFWQVRLFRNPWYKDGNVLPGVHCISMNFEGRNPLYEWEPRDTEDLPPQCKAEKTLNIQ